MHFVNCNAASSYRPERPSVFAYRWDANDTGIGDTSGVQITIGIAGIAGVPVEGGPAGEDGMAWSTYVE